MSREEMTKALIKQTINWIEKNKDSEVYILTNFSDVFCHNFKSLLVNYVPWSTLKKIKPRFINFDLTNGKLTKLRISIYSEESIKNINEIIEKELKKYNNEENIIMENIQNPKCLLDLQVLNNFKF